MHFNESLARVRTAEAALREAMKAAAEARQAHRHAQAAAAELRKAPPGGPMGRAAIEADLTDARAREVADEAEAAANEARFALMEAVRAAEAARQSAAATAGKGRFDEAVAGAAPLVRAWLDAHQSAGIDPDEGALWSAIRSRAHAIPPSTGGLPYTDAPVTSDLLRS